MIFRENNNIRGVFLNSVATSFFSVTLDVLVLILLFYKSVLLFVFNCKC